MYKHNEIKGAFKTSGVFRGEPFIVRSVYWTTLEDVLKEHIQMIRCNTQAKREYPHRKVIETKWGYKYDVTFAYLYMKECEPKKMWNSRDFVNEDLKGWEPIERKYYEESE